MSSPLEEVVKSDDIIRSGGGFAVVVVVTGLFVALEVIIGLLNTVVELYLVVLAGSVVVSIITVGSSVLAMVDEEDVRSLFLEGGDLYGGYDGGGDGGGGGGGATSISTRIKASLCSKIIQFKTNKLNLCLN